MPLDSIQQDTVSLSDINEQTADEIILVLAQEDPRAFEILVRRYQGAFLRAAFRVVRRQEDAEDVVQDAFVKIYRYAGKFVKRENIEFKSWAYRVLLNTAFTHYQRLKKQWTREDADSEGAFAATPAEPEGSGIEDRLDAKMRIEEAFLELPDELVVVLRKHYIEDKAYQTIAEEEETTVAAIKMRLFRARKAMKKLFSDRSGFQE